MTLPIYAPPYYRDFACIKGDCRHTCCAGWRIGVDEDTLTFYDTLGGEMGNTIREWLAMDEEGAYIPLTDCGRCPHLTKDGLCRIISALGEGATSKICREHPRFYNALGDRIEVGLGMSCEAAARLILSSDEYLPTVWVGDSEADRTDAELITERDRMLKILSDKSSPYRSRLERLMFEYKIPKGVLSPEKWRKIFEELEYKSAEGARLITAMPCGRCEREDVLERFLAYMIYRHVGAAENATDMRARLGFCILSVAVFESMVASGGTTESEITEAARLYSEEIEYSEDNTDTLIFEIECEII